MVLAVNKFWCCFELETAGLFLGYMGIFFHGLVLVIITLVLLFASSLITNALSDMSEDSSFPSMVNNRNKRDIDNEYSKNVSDIARHSSDDADVQGIVGIGIGFLVAALIIVYAILIVKLWGYVSLLNGTKRRDHKKVLIYVIIDAIFTILLLVPFIWFGISGVTIDLISIYYSVCTFSLYKKLEMESINGVGQYQLTTITTAYQQPQVIGYQQPQMIGYQQPQVQAPFEYPQVPDYQKPQNLPNESN